MKRNHKVCVFLFLFILFAFLFVACDKKTEPIVPEFVTPTVGATYGQILGDLALPDGFSWEEPLTTSVGEVGSHVFHVTYTPSDTSAFQTVTGIEVTVTVTKGTPQPSTVATLNAVYGQTLENIGLSDLNTQAGTFTWQEPLTTSVGDAGDRVFHLVFTPADSINFNIVEKIPVTVRVAKATYDMSGVSLDNSTFAFDGLTKSLAISGVLPEGVNVSYDNNYQKDLGNHTVVAHFVGDDNHEPIADMTATLSIVIDEKTAFGNLPVIYINTQDNVFPYDKETYINCSFKLTNTESFNMDLPMKESIDDSGSIGVKLRGNSTLLFPKKAFKIKFDKKQSLLGMTKAKSWALRADYIDQSKIRNYATYAIAGYFDGLGFTPSPYHVIVFVNGQYQGLYLLTEQIDEKQGRRDVEEDFIIGEGNDYPFLVEYDYYGWQEIDINKDIIDIDQISPLEIKYPDYNDRIKAGITDEADPIINYVKDYFKAIEKTLLLNDSVEFNGRIVGFADLVDENSFIDYHIVNEIMVNPDGCNKSIYFYKSIDSKVIMGPLWDYDYCCGIEFSNDKYQRTGIAFAYMMYGYLHDYYFNLYLQNEDNYLKVANRYHEVYEALIDKANGVNKLLREYESTIFYPAIIDANYWYGETGEFQFEMQYDYVRLFINERLDFLNEAFNLSYEQFMQSLIWE